MASIDDRVGRVPSNFIGEAAQLDRRAGDLAGQARKAQRGFSVGYLHQRIAFGFELTCQRAKQACARRRMA